MAGGNNINRPGMRVSVERGRRTVLLQLSPAFGGGGGTVRGLRCSARAGTGSFSRRGGAGPADRRSKPPPTPAGSRCRARPTWMPARCRTGEERPARSPAGRGCPDLDVEYNVAAAFVEGVTSSFVLRITPRRDGLKNLVVEARHGHLRLSHAADEHLMEGQRFRAFLSFRPTGGLYGKIPFEIYLGYEADGEKVCYKFWGEHRVFPAREKAVKVLETLKIEFNASQGHAGDVRQSVQGLDRMLSQKADRAEDLRLVDLPPIWERPRLLRCAYSVMAPPPARSGPAEAACDRLSLCVEGKWVHILSDARVQLGRNRKTT